ncbi:hypothetical protein AX774_g4242 [Zancudomyces culisetae]|uniref:Uncharacterized protein n=1 Tax=Zancudomyces culisetae TaxID=1213189 RepID=A0A1R1PMU6_ZANCU|nr:hypothetical protein AX774_g4242 [Zancudomyces culisetae]|eukprot:OMH82278.1 hypothetical protein AX774_g4242 [Zancudomyces culisetae]
MFYFDPASYTGMTEKSTLISSYRYEHDRMDLSEAKPQIQNKILQSVKDSLDKSDDSAYSGNMFDNDEFNSRGINKIMSQYNDESGGGSIQDTCDTTITFNKDLTERANGKGSNMTIEYLLWDIINQDYREIENKLIKRLDKNYENVYDNLVYNVYYYQYHHNHENNCGKKANNKSSKYTDLHARSFSSKNENTE